MTGRFSPMPFRGVPSITSVLHYSGHDGFEWPRHGSHVWQRISAWALLFHTSQRCCDCTPELARCMTSCILLDISSSVNGSPCPTSGPEDYFAYLLRIPP